MRLIMFIPATNFAASALSATLSSEFFLTRHITCKGLIFSSLLKRADSQVTLQNILGQYAQAPTRDALTLLQTRTKVQR